MNGVIIIVTQLIHEKPTDSCECEQEPQREKEKEKGRAVQIAREREMNEMGGSGSWR